MITATHQLTEERVFNWARWLSQNGSPRQRCASAEGMYVAPAVDDDKHEYIRLGQIDVVDAEIIERAVIQLPSDGRRFMKMFYVDRASKRIVMLKFRFTDIEAVDSFRLRNLSDIARLTQTYRETTLIRRGQPIWAGTCQPKKVSV